MRNTYDSRARDQRLAQGRTTPDTASRSEWLSQSEIDDLCRPLTQPAAQANFLIAAGLPVLRRPDRRVIVLRADLHRLTNPPERAQSAFPREPNVLALEQSLRRVRRSR